MTSFCLLTLLASSRKMTDSVEVNIKTILTTKIITPRELPNSSDRRWRTSIVFGANRCRLVLRKRSIKKINSSNYENEIIVSNLKSSLDLDIIHIYVALRYVKEWSLTPNSHLKSFRDVHLSGPQVTLRRKPQSFEDWHGSVRQCIRLENHTEVKCRGSAKVLHQFVKTVLSISHDMKTKNRVESQCGK